MPNFRALIKNIEKMAESRSIIIGREKEIRELEDILNSRKAEFVVVYGRRRVGKTYLVREFFNNKFAFHHTGLSPFELSEENILAEQLKSFALTLSRFGRAEGNCPNSWMEAFEMLRDLLEKRKEKGKKVVFIDEMPWMDTPRSGFMTAFEHFWNGWASGCRDIILVVCGSATSWINDTLINNHGGLYDRVTRTIHLSPFDLKESRELLESEGIQINDYNLVQSQMIFGGIPFYLSNFRRDMSLPQNIDRMFFEKDAKLKNEFSRLFSSSFTNAEVCEKIVRLLFKRKYGYTRNELAKMSGNTTGGTFSKILEGLESSGIIISYRNLRDKRKIYYKLIDSFCLFYLTFVDGNKTSDEHFWQNSSNSQSIESWCGISFENLCFAHINQIRQALGISGVRTEVSTWIFPGDEEHQGAQIDMVLTRADGIINLCEMKFSRNDFTVTKDYDRRLRERTETFREIEKTRKTIHNTLITTYGLKHNAWSDLFQSTVTIDALLK